MHRSTFENKTSRRSPPPRHHSHLSPPSFPSSSGDKLIAERSKVLPYNATNPTSDQTSALPSRQDTSKQTKDVAGRVLDGPSVLKTSKGGRPVWMSAFEPKVDREWAASERMRIAPERTESRQEECGRSRNNENEWHRDGSTKQHPAIDRNTRPPSLPQRPPSPQRSILLTAHRTDPLPPKPPPPVAPRIKLQEMNTKKRKIDIALRTDIARKKPTKEAPSPAESQPQWPLDRFGVPISEEELARRERQREAARQQKQEKERKEKERKEKKRKAKERKAKEQQEHRLPPSSTTVNPAPARQTERDADRQLAYRLLNEEKAALEAALKARWLTHDDSIAATLEERPQKKLKFDPKPPPPRAQAAPRTLVIDSHPDSVFTSHEGKRQPLLEEEEKSTQFPREETNKDVRTDKQEPPQIKRRTSGMPESDRDDVDVHASWERYREYVRLEALKKGEVLSKRQVRRRTETMQHRFKLKQKKKEKQQQKQKKRNTECDEQDDKHSGTEDRAGWYDDGREMAVEDRVREREESERHQAEEDGWGSENGIDRGGDGDRQARIKKERTDASKTSRDTPDWDWEEDREVVKKREKDADWFLDIEKDLNTEPGEANDLSIKKELGTEEDEPNEREMEALQHDSNPPKPVYVLRKAPGNPLIKPPKRPRPVVSTTTSTTRTLPSKPPPPLEAVSELHLQHLNQVLDELQYAHASCDWPAFTRNLDLLSWTLSPPEISYSSLNHPTIQMPVHLAAPLVNLETPEPVKLAITILLKRWESTVYTPSPQQRWPKRGTYGYPDPAPGHLSFPLGTVFPSQWDAYLSGIHPSHEAGITGNTTYGAYSIVLSLSPYADRDNGTHLFYTGTVSSSSDGVATRGTELLSTSRRLGTPVRVLRSAKHGGYWSPVVGLRYDGLYRVVGEEPIMRNRRFELVRCPVGSGREENPFSLEACRTRPSSAEVKWIEEVLDGRRMQGRGVGGGVIKGF